MRRCRRNEGELRQFGDRERAEDGDYTAQYPAKNDRARLVQLSGYCGGYTKNAAANGDPDEHGNRIEQANLARKALTPAVGLRCSHAVARCGNAPTRPGRCIDTHPAVATSLGTSFCI